MPCLAAFPPPPTATRPPHLDVGDNAAAVRDTHLVAFLKSLTYSEAKNRHKLTFFKGYITQDLDSEEVFRGIGIFCRFVVLKDFLRYRPLKKVWADPPTAVRFRVKLHTFERR